MNYLKYYLEYLTEAEGGFWDSFKKSFADELKANKTQRDNIESTNTTFNIGKSGDFDKGYKHGFKLTTEPKYFDTEDLKARVSKYIKYKQSIISGEYSLREQLTE